MNQLISVAILYYYFVYEVVCFIIVSRKKIVIRVSSKDFRWMSKESANAFNKTFQENHLEMLTQVMLWFKPLAKILD